MTPWKKSNMLLREHEDGNYEAEIDYIMNEDSYEEGELLNGRSWKGHFYVSGHSISEIFYKLNSDYGASTNISNWWNPNIESDPNENGEIASNTVVNRYVNIPSEEEWKKFEKGELNLFIMDIIMGIYDKDYHRYLSLKEIIDEYFYELHSVEEEEDYDEGFEDIEESVKKKTQKKIKVLRRKL